MNNRERVLATLNHQQPDQVPYHISFTQKAAKAMADYLGDADFQRTLGNCLTGFSSMQEPYWTMVGEDVREDPFGVQWDVSVDKDIGVVCNRRVTPETLDAYQFPPVPELAFLREARVRGDQFILIDLGFSLFERAWTLAGMENVLMAMVDDPEFINRLLDRILEYNLGVIDTACAQDIDAMMFGDDWGQQRGLIMGPELWREYIKPRIAQMYGRVRAAGKFVFIHSCGKVDAVFPDLIEIGLNVFNPFQPEVIDVFEAKRQYGRDLSFFGGISTQRLLPYGTVAQVKDEVKRLLDIVGKDGGYIAAPAHATPGDAKPENIAAMLEVLQNQ
ncbi:MAG: uroporphyrinogen decarboxylase family protein [Armatimonadota bacterium]